MICIVSPDSCQYTTLMYKHTHTHRSQRAFVDHNSPFLPELGGPGGLSVTEPLKRKHGVKKEKKIFKAGCFRIMHYKHINIQPKLIKRHAHIAVQS